MGKIRLIAILLLLASVGVAYFAIAPRTNSAMFPIKLGLDLSGGTQLTYRADVSKLQPSEVNESMAALRDVIERRVNLFGVSEPVVQVEGGSLVAGTASEHRLLVELPGVTDVDEAIALIGKTPVLQFKLLKENAKPAPTLSPTFATSSSGKFSFGSSTAPTSSTEGLIATTSATTSSVSATGTASSAEATDDQYIDTPLTGRYLTGASVQFNQVTGEPVVALKFNSEGAALFAKITGENVGHVLAIFLDGAPISQPVINEEISGGQAIISGNFSPEEAKTLVGRLNAGALPVPIELLSSQTVGATLGAKSFTDGIEAGIIAFIIIALFMILWYRLPGFVAVLALSAYAVITIALFRLIPVTLTAAGIAGFILSIGMAVDANILIFERTKEEFRKGHSLEDATKMGFTRAWPAIRDSHFSSIITAIVLFWLGTSVVKGFALVFGLGVVVSLFSAVTLTRVYLVSLGISGRHPILRFLFGSGMYIPKKEEAEA